MNSRIKARQAFLQWAWVNVVVAIVLTTACVMAWSHIAAPESRVGAGLILGIFVLASAYHGHTLWMWENDPDHRLATYRKRHVEFAADKLPWVGMIGTMVGILILFLGASNSDPHQLADHVVRGLSTAFVPSILGAVGALVLDTLCHMLDQTLARG